MRITSVPSVVSGIERVGEATGGKVTGGSAFGSALADAVRRLDAVQKDADRMVEGMLSGEVEHVHDVVIALQEAHLSLRMAIEVRNKVVEAYNDIMRMQV